MTEIKKQLQETFERIYCYEGNYRYFFSPGRVNLIGEHTDYNGGHVFPCAIQLGIYAVISMREDKFIRYYSMNEEDTGVIYRDVENIGDFSYGRTWSDYVSGMIYALINEGYEIDRGFDLVICGNLTVGAGLSSSAALEVLTGYICKTVYNLDITNDFIAVLGQRVENDYIGVKSGIMDQFAIAMAEEHKALYLDTSTLEYRSIPVNMGDYIFVIMNTNKKRELADSKYNERRRECEDALEELRAVLDIQSLGELSIPQFEEYAYLITDEVKRRRAKHAVYENQRTNLAVQVLLADKLDLFGQLMNASHESLRKDYEVTGVELDTLVDSARECDHVLGARMTGAGFGGCAIALVKYEYALIMQEYVKKKYLEKIGYEPSFYEVEICGGPREL